MKTKGHLYFSTFLILVAGYVIFTASQWSFKTGFFPLAIAIPLLILALLQLGLEVFGAPETSKGPAVEAEFSAEVAPEVARRRAVTIFCWFAAFILFVHLIGFPLTVPLFILFYLKFQSDAGWIHSLALTVITWACFYTLFQRLVHIQFEAGAIQTWLGI